MMLGTRFRIGDWIVNENGGPARMVVDVVCIQRGGVLRLAPERLIVSRRYAAGDTVEIEIHAGLYRLATNEEIPR